MRFWQDEPGCVENLVQAADNHRLAINAVLSAMLMPKKWRQSFAAGFR
jgi:hypothetical protein